MNQQSIPNVRALKKRVAKMSPALRDKIATLGLQRLYEMAEVAGYRDLNSCVRKQLKRLDTE